MHGRAGDWLGEFPEERDGAEADGTTTTQSLRLDEVRTHEWHILQCSAMTGTNLQEGLAWVVSDAKKRLFLY